MRLQHLTTGLVVLVIAGAGAFLAVRLISAQIVDDGERNAVAQEDSQPPFMLPPRPTIDAAIEAEQRKEPFEGELLGIFVAASAESVPEGLKPKPCEGPGRAVPYSAGAAGEMHLDLALPLEYDLRADSPDTAVSSCDGNVTLARREYGVQSSNGLEARVIVGRGVFRQTNYHRAPADRVGVTEIGGRQAILIEPVNVDGLPEAFYSQSAVYFPEQFGMTFVLGFELPLSDLLALSELVAAATKP